MKLTRHMLREKGMTCIYQHLLLNKDIKEVVFENSEDNQVDGFLYAITIDCIKYKDIYIEKINELLKGWEFSRLGYIEQAILLIAICELDFENTPKAIVINEAIQLAKRYCADDAYKLINGVLDRL